MRRATIVCSGGGGGWQVLLLLYQLAAQCTTQQQVHAVASNLPLIPDVLLLLSNRGLKRNCSG
jgi:hypothetical protein